MANITIKVDASHLTESGDDVYAKPVYDATGYVLDEINWGDDVVRMTEDGTQNTYSSALIDDVSIYTVYRNLSSIAFTADNASDTYTSAAHGLSNSFTVLVKGEDLPNGLSQSTLYYVVNAATNTFQLSTSDGGAAVSISDDGSGVMTVVSLEDRSSSDEKVASIHRESEPETLAGEGQVSREQAINANILTILADIQDGGRLDLIIDAINSQTDASAIRTAIGLAAANLDTQFAALLTQIGLIGSNQSSITNPTAAASDPLDLHLFKDMSFNISASTDASSRLIFSVRRKLTQEDPDIRIDTTSGLLIVKDVDSPTAGHGVVTRVSDSQVSIYLKADAWDHLDDGTYWMDLTEITASGLTILRFCNMGNFVRSAGRVMAS